MNYYDKLKANKEAIELILEYLYHPINDDQRFILTCILIELTGHKFINLDELELDLKEV